MPHRHYHVIFNPNAGTALASGVTTDQLRDLFAQAGLSVDVDDDETSPIPDRTARALEGPADVVVAAGGDGTVLAVAEGLMGSDKTLALLPLGTLNGLVRDLQLPLDLKGAIEALSGLEPCAIDVAEVNGRPFLHNVIIGLVPSIAVGREFVRGKGWTDKLKFMGFMIRRFARARRMALVLQADDTPARIERVQTLVVANNSYEQRFGKIMSRRRLDRGSLTAYLIRSFRLGDAIRLAVEMFWGAWRDDEVIEFEKVQRLIVQSKRRTVLATMDGEVLTMDLPLEFRVRPKSLQVLAPAAPGQAGANTTASEAAPA